MIEARHLRPSNVVIVVQHDWRMQERCAVVLQAGDEKVVLLEVLPCRQVPEQLGVGCVPGGNSAAEGLEQRSELVASVKWTSDAKIAVWRALGWTGGGCCRL